MIESLKGTEDILPPATGLWRHLETKARDVFSKYCYEEIRTPIIEPTPLFIRGVGKDSEIVQKQMYSFLDQGGRNICLRPEATASVVRAYIQHNLYKIDNFAKFFYFGPMYRSEKPQAGRQREFNQVGVEVIGSYSPYADCEVIVLLDSLLKALSVKDYKLKINSLGCSKDKEEFKKYLKTELKHQENKLCEDCQKRYQTNILRILDCKNEGCKSVLRSLKISTNHLCPECSSEFKTILHVLGKENINYEPDPFLVRGLDYYTKTVFEAVANGLGSQDAVAAGGRYDNLVSDLGGPNTGACGFAIGFERILNIVKPENLDYKPGQVSLFIVTMDEDARQAAFTIQYDLRKNNISCDTDYQGKSLKAQMRYADKIKAKFIIVIGSDELQKKEVNLKNMETGEQKSVKFEQLRELLC